MTRDKIKSDISILKDQLLKENYKIIIIETQLETKELNADGSNEYFNWRIRAIKAINFKRARINSMKRQLNHWEYLLQQMKTESQIQLKREGIAHSKELFDKNTKLKKEASILKILRHDKLIKDQLTREQEKTKRHRESEGGEILIAREFKKLVKKLIGEHEYIELIQLAQMNYESKKVK